MKIFITLYIVSILTIIHELVIVNDYTLLFHYHMSTHTNLFYFHSMNIQGEVCVKILHRYFWREKHVHSYREFTPIFNNQSLY